MKSIALQGNIEQNEIYMMSIMLNKLNEFGKKVQVDMVCVKCGKS
ncbi:putative transposase [Acinetobacter baumannii 348935]|nr:putative transposase [Acinetobacter baumannii 348935]